MNLYEFISGQNDESDCDDDILLPRIMENDLLLCLTKMRAHNYNIEVLDNDSTLILKGQKALSGCLLKSIHFLICVFSLFENKVFSADACWA